MALNDQYRRQVGLLVEILPFVALESCFALKGGTAINLFVRDLPRLSVDIDLTYLPVENRDASLGNIHAAMQRIAKDVKQNLKDVRIHQVVHEKEKFICKLIVRLFDIQIKIEVTPVTRGSVYEPSLKSVSPRVEDEFGFAEIQVVSFADLYAGKIVAALDRQHPRDLFDVRDLFLNEGIDTLLRNAFIVYLISHNRPLGEILAPVRKDISQEFARGFNGMTSTTVSLDELLEVREKLIAEIVGKMPIAHREMLISFCLGQPDWSLLDLPHVANLPAVKWRIENLAKQNKQRRDEQFAHLKAVLDAV